MDSPTLNHVSLCAGYGGIDLGLRRAIPSLRTVAFAEIEGFACANLVAKMEAGHLDSAPIWTDLKTFPYAKFRGLVDILSGGYPCQPFSAAGQRRGKDDPRHLWPWIADGIAAMRPAVCFFENVEGHISLGLSDVIEDLAGMGYRTTWGIFSAAEVGAPHQRKRVFILAHRNGERGLLPNRWGQSAEQVPVCDGATWRDVWPSRPGQAQFNWEPPRVVGDAASWQDDRRESRDLGQTEGEGRCGDHAADCAGESRLADTKNANDEAWGISWRDNGSEFVWQQNNSTRQSQHRGTGSHLRGSKAGETQRTLGRDSDGSSSRMGDAELFTSSDNRTDELRLLGNGVVPATAERAFRILMDQLYAANT